VEQLKRRYNLAKQALKTFDEAVTDFENRMAFPTQQSFSEEKLEELLRDSVIKRFEYSVDTVWKFLKEYIKKKYGVELASPKPVLRECFRNKLLNEKEIELALKMIDDRNDAVHAYNIEVADVVSEAAIEYCHLLKTLLERVVIPIL
jgi:nucleotidyltransferase substrate binding protein (TIGR01987 family)